MTNAIIINVMPSEIQKMMAQKLRELNFLVTFEVEAKPGTPEVYMKVSVGEGDIPIYTVAIIYGDRHVTLYIPNHKDDIVSAFASITQVGHVPMSGLTPHIYNVSNLEHY